MQHKIVMRVVLVTKHLTSTIAVQDSILLFRLNNQTLLSCIFPDELVVVSHETKQAYEQCGGSGKKFTTGLICGNAAGEILPPFIIYSSKTLNPLWTNGGPSGSQFAVSDSGWITKSLFYSLNDLDGLLTTRKMLINQYC